MKDRNNNYGIRNCFLGTVLVGGLVLAGVSEFEVSDLRDVGGVEKVVSSSDVVSSSEVPKKLIVVDSGHGMNNRTKGAYDPGAVSSEYKEAKIVFGQAKEIEKMLVKRGYDVIVIGGRESGMHYKKRSGFAKDNNADLFVSLHCNGSDKKSAHGQEVYYWKSDDSRKLAECIQGSLVAEVSKTDESYVKDRGVKTANFAVLKSEGFPSVLVESGFITSEHDRKYLTDEVYDVERGVVNGIEKYFDSKE